MEFMKDKINVLLLIGTIIFASGLFFVYNYLCRILLVVCALILLATFVDRVSKK